MLHLRCRRLCGPLRLLLIAFRERNALLAFLALALDALVGADARPQALLALAPAAVMLAYLRSPAFLARALDALVGADARPQALLALAPDAVMLAYLRSAAFLARALDALVRADARPQALLALAPAAGRS